MPYYGPFPSTPLPTSTRTATQSCMRDVSVVWDKHPNLSAPPRQQSMMSRTWAPAAQDVLKTWQCQDFPCCDAACRVRRAAVTRRDVAQQLNVWPISVGVRSRPLTPFMPASAVQLLRRLCQWIVSDSSQSVTQKRQLVTAAATAYDSNHFYGPSRHLSKWDMTTSDTTWQLWKLLVMNHHHTVDLFRRIAMK